MFHTKGPWIVKRGPFCITVETEDNIISEQYLSDDDDVFARDWERRCVGNACLIAAAPLLLRSLEACQPFADANGFVNGVNIVDAFQRATQNND